ncbi:SDR family NAD(P)-dependent oxidoreductase [Gracilibacillus kekensis]|uniref:3-oxoacyl-[acyl-carrier protein] reductase n=1 Tax=Gracilibacillus kekensis TaxID=1027249 RepID=A0A1M7Q852_9BACI|nr:SDR family oxidoreductase [Gracilibacillus kekensis]SHN26800.1 3-oxoacyl-[acyl-carrier protein] reductase [Gracilibacillus kekensis]
MELQGKTVLVTGAATGIGRAIALKLARKGTNIAVNYTKSINEAEQTLEEIKALGVQGMLVQADVSDNKQVTKMCNHVLNKLGAIDILVNNAGTTNYVALEDLDGMKDEYWDNAFNVNVKGMFYTSRACQEELRKNKGCIVNVTSIAGFNGSGSSMAYAASKAAGISVTKSLARALAPDVRVNSVAPGIVLTRWVNGQEEHIDKHSSGTLLERVAKPEDVADMVYGIIAGGDFVTGQTIVVDGGFTIH